MPSSWIGHDVHAWILRINASVASTCKLKLRLCAVVLHQYRGLSQFLARGVAEVRLAAHIRNTLCQIVQYVHEMNQINYDQE